MRALSSFPIAGTVRTAGVAPAADRAWWVSGDTRLTDCTLGAVLADGVHLEPALDLHVGPLPRAVRFALRGGLLLVAEPGRLGVHDLTGSGDCPQSHPLDDNVVDLASVDGRRVHVARALTWPPLKSLDLASGSVEERRPRREQVSTHRPLVALSPDGRHLAFGHVLDGIEIFNLADGTSRLWPREADAWTDERVAASDLLSRLVFGADGAILAAVSQPPRGGTPLLRWGGPEGRDVRELLLEQHRPQVGLDAGGHFMAAVRCDDPHQVEILDLEDSTVHASAAADAHVMALGLDLASGRLALVHSAGVSLFAVESL